MRFTLVLLAILATGCGHRRRPPEIKPADSTTSHPPDDASRSYDLGVRLYTEKNYLEARAAFEQSYRLAHRPAALIGVAESDRSLKHSGAAYEDYARLLEVHRAELDPKDVQRAEAAIAELRPLTASLVLNLEDGVEVEVDGRSWGKAPLAKSTHRLKAMKHTIRVSKPGVPPWEQTIVLGPDDSKTIDVKLEGDKNAAAQSNVTQMSESDRKATARAAYLEGVALQEKGSCADALERFLTAEKLFDAPTHLVRIGECQATLGKLVEAQETYETLTHAKLDAQAPEAFHKAQESGKTALAALKPRVPMLRLQTVPALATLDKPVVEINGKSMPAELLGLARPVNPGRYLIVVTAGARTGRAVFEIKEGETRSVDVRMGK